jgi:uncharacterized repeat protein (TIGR02543 family)
MRSLKRILCLTLVCLLCLALLPMGVLAEENASDESVSTAQTGSDSYTEAPSQPETPSVSESPSVSEQPSQPETPSVSEQPAETEQPTETEQPDEAEQTPSSTAKPSKTGSTSYTGRTSTSSAVSYSYTYYDSGANEKAVFNFLVDTLGLNAAAASGVLANIYYESGFNPNKYGDNGSSYGICQWHNDRLTNLKNYCSRNGYDYTTLTGQLHFLAYELWYSYSSVWNYLNSVSNTADGAYNAGYYWCYNYEKPSSRASASRERGSAAQYTYWPEYESASVEKYTVSFYANGGTGHMDEQTALYGSELTLADNEFTRSGYSFTGWIVRRDADDTWYVDGQGWLTASEMNEGEYEAYIYSDGTTVIFDDSWTSGCSEVSDYTFFAVWNDSPDVTVHFDANGGSAAAESVGVVYGETYGELPTAIRSGYVFLGWYTAASTGSEVTADDTVSRAYDHTLYAHWADDTYLFAQGEDEDSSSEETFAGNLGSLFGIPDTVFSTITFQF